MAIAHVQNWSVTEANMGGATSLESAASGSTVTAGNCVVVAITSFLAAIPTAVVAGVVDDLGNTYSLAKRQGGSDVGFGDRTDCEIWYCLNVLGGGVGKITVTLSLAFANLSFAVAEFSGVATSSALDGAGSSNKSDSPTNTVWSTGTFSTTNANDLLVAAYAIDNTQSSVTPDTGFASFGSAEGGSGMGLECQWKVVSATQTNVNPTMTGDVATRYCGAGVAFMAATVVSYTLMGQACL